MTRPTLTCLLVVCLAALLGLSAGCATQAPTRSGFIDKDQPMVRTQNTVRVQVDVRSDAARLAQVRSLRIEPAKVADGVTLPSTISPDSIALILGEIERQMCFELSRYFDIEPTTAASAATPQVATTTVRAAVTGLQETNPTASVASAIISRLIPGPGNIRLPIGRGGLSMEASADLPNGGGEAAAMAWSRGAGIAFDKGSLSEVGDAHRFATNFAKNFTALLAGPDAKKRDLPKIDPCAQYGPRSDLGRSALSFGLGLHMPKPVAAEKTNANSPEPKDLAAPTDQ